MDTYAFVPHHDHRSQYLASQATGSKRLATRHPSRTATRNLAEAVTNIAIISDGDAVARGYFENLVFAITVEGSQLDGVCGRSGPVERGGVALMTHNQLAALLLTWQANHERANL
jgi:hypothetical protein